MATAMLAPSLFKIITNKRGVLVIRSRAILTPRTTTATTMDLSRLNSPLDIFDCYARTTPDAPFLVEDAHTSLSYLESYVLTKELLGPRLRGVCPSLSPTSPTQPRVLLITPNNSLLLLTTIALWRLSCVAVLVQPRVEPELWTGMISCSKPSLVIAASSAFVQVERCVADYNLVAKTDIPVLSLHSLLPPEFWPDHAAVPRLSNYIPSCQRWIQSVFSDRAAQVVAAVLDVPEGTRVGDAVTLFTSSAVDQNTVKGVTYTHSFLVSSSIRTIETMGVDLNEFHGQRNRHLGWMPLTHCFEFGISFCGIVLTSGGSYVFFDSAVSSSSLSASVSLPKQLLVALAYFGDIVSFSGVPFISQGIADVASLEDLARLRRLRYFNVAGAPTSSSLFHWMVENKIAYADSCGATEVLWIACRRAWHPEESIRGLSLCPGLKGVIKRARADDTFGELIVFGKDIPSRYDNVNSGAFSFDDRSNITTYRTGDLYRQDENLRTSAFMLEGQPAPTFEEACSLTGISYIGRIDDTVVLSTGEKVDAHAIEQGLEQRADIERCAILADVHGVALLALIQPRSSSDLTIDWSALTDAVLHVNLSLPFEKRIRREHIFFVAQLPLTGKNTLHRKRLRSIIASLSLNSEVPQLFSTPDGAPRNVLRPAIEPRTTVSPALRTSATAQTPRLSHLSSPTSASILSQPSSDRSPVAVAGPPHTGIEIRDEVVNILARVFDVPREHFEHCSTALSDLPLTSLASVEVSRTLSQAFSVKLRPAEMYAMHTVEDVCAAVQRHQHAGQVRVPPRQTSTPASIPEDSSCYMRTTSSPPQHICISGAACRFVGGIDSLSDYWSALTAPDMFLESFSRVEETTRRPTACSAYGSTLSLGDAASGFTTVESFAKFFGIPPQDVEAMSLNTRLVLQVGYQAIQDAGLAPSSLSGKRWGIFTAVNESGWRIRQSAKSTPDAFASHLLNLADDTAAGRLAYYLNVTGPAIDIKTACSSSAVAIHQASLAIRNNDCDAAIVIAATTHVDPASTAFRMKAGIASPSGRCLPFSQWADGFVPGEGAAAIVLQKYSDTAAEPYAILRTSAVVQDGTSRGFLSPNPIAQKDLLKTALTRAGCGQDDVCFIEAHGTGTQLGDSVELLALADVYRDAEHPLYIGSSKAVIGHTEECAGLAGVLKAVLCFKHNAIPPQPFTGPLNEMLESSHARFVLPYQLTPLRPSLQPRLIGISSFGLSGTLAHVFLQELPPHHAAASHALIDARSHAFVISAATENDLRALAKRYLRYLGRQHLQLDRFSSMCIASRLTRDHHAVRRAFFVRNWRELLDQLQAALLAHIPRMSTTNVTVGIWFGMPLGPNRNAPIDATGCALYESELGRLSWQLQYRFFAAQLALARTLEQLGVTIHAVGGEGGGELVAGVVAGTVTSSAVFRAAELAEENAAFAIAHCSLDILEEYLATCTADEATLIGHHASNTFTLRGTRAGLEALATVADLNIDIQKDDAFIRPCLVNDQTTFKVPTIPLVSANIGGACDDATATSAVHWTRVQQSFVDGERAFEALAEQCQVVVHLGLPEAMHQSRAHTIAMGGYLEELLCHLYEAGCDIAWKKLDTGSWPMERIPGYVWAPSNTS